MKTFSVKFKIISTYEDSEENVEREYVKKYKSTKLEDLFEQLENEMEEFIIEDDQTINPNANRDLIETNKEYIEIKDENGRVVYTDNNT